MGASILQLFQSFCGMRKEAGLYSRGSLYSGIFGSLIQYPHLTSRRTSPFADRRHAFQYQPSRRNFETRG